MPRKYDGKFSLTDFSRWDEVPEAKGGEIYTLIAYSVCLKHQVRVVALCSEDRLELLYSTDVTIKAIKIIELYRARFAMEFPFRDGKQFAGLNDCQSRQTEAIHFHWNMTLLAVTTARLSQLRNQRENPLVFSMEDEKRLAYNTFFINRILSIFAEKQTKLKWIHRLQQLLSLDVKAA